MSIITKSMTEVFHYTSQLQGPHPPSNLPPLSSPMIRQWWTEKRAHAGSPCPSDCGGCLLSGQRAQSPPADCPLPLPQHHTLGQLTRGPPHFTKRDHNPFAGKIRGLPVASGPAEDSGWHRRTCVSRRVCVCVREEILFVS